MTARLYAGLAILVAALFVLSLSVGRVTLPWSVWTGGGDELLRTILLELRLPRAVLGIAVGAALAGSGAALQGYTRNPLADPGVLGISTMAALGAVLTLYTGTAGSTPWILSMAAMAGAGVGVILLLLLGGLTASIATFILAGVILNSLAGSAVALALNFASSPWAAQEIMNWLLGSLTDRSVIEIRASIPFIALGLLILFTQARALDALTLGEAGARSLGVNLERCRLLIALGVGLASGAAVAVTGVIGFVGLVVPHLIRPLVGHRPSRILGPSALAGAALILAADIIVRLVPSTTEIRLGVALSAIGAPFFLWLLIGLRRKLA